MSKNRITLILMFVFLTLVILSGCANYKKNNKILVKDDENEIKAGIEKKINMNADDDVEITIKNKEYIDNVIVISFVVNNGMNGNATLYKENDEKYFVGGCGYNTNVINMKKVDTENGRYLVVFGEKYNVKVQYLKVELEDEKYVFEIGGNDYFVGYYMISNKIKDVNTTNYWFYDENNKEIKDLYIK